MGNSAAFILYSGYINDWYTNTIRDKLKSLMRHFELDKEARLSVINILQGFATGSFESGILYAGISMTLKQAALIFTALSYIGFFFIAFGQIQLALLSKAHDQC